MTTQYLIRIDDICPTMNWAVWRAVEDVLVRYNISPLLAVVPDNQDPHLQITPARVDFWDCVRRWQALGWTIGLHGYRHSYVTRESGLLGINSFSEFAGLPEAEQLAWLRAALDIFRREGVSTDLCVAPAHSFDAATLRALIQVGIRTVSDGFSLFPYTDPQGLFWVPQQLGRFRRLPFGVWTICLHTNAWLTADLSTFAEWIARYHHSIVGFSEVVERYRGRSLSTLDRCFQSACHTRLRFRRAIRTPGSLAISADRRRRPTFAK